MSPFSNSARSATAYFAAMLAFIALPAGPLAADDEAGSFAPGTYGDLSIGATTTFWNFTPRLSGWDVLGVKAWDSVDEVVTSVGLDVNVALPAGRRGAFLLGAIGGGFGDGDWAGRLNLNGLDINIDGRMKGYGALYAGFRAPVWTCPQGHQISLDVRGGGGFVNYDVTVTSDIAALPVFGNQDQNFGNQNQNFGNRNQDRTSFSQTKGMAFADARLRYDVPRIAGFSVAVGGGFWATEDTSFSAQTQAGEVGFDIDNGVDGYGILEISLRYASDRRLKRDIRHIATRRDGLRLYAFKYLWSETTYVGVMAQDLLRNADWRGAVSTTANGYYAVDYGALGFRMTTLEEPKRL